MTEGENIKQIVFLDDEASVRALFKLAIAELGVEADLTMESDPEKFMENLDVRNYAPDLIFLDINMPKKNGKECLKEIRIRERFQLVPVFIYSASTYAKDIEETYSLGANLYIVKPFGFEQELDLLRKVFKLSKSDYDPKPTREKFVMEWVPLAE